MNQRRPKIGLAVIVKKGDKVLLGLRVNAHGHNTWSFPGGHLEFNESFENCAKREVTEETGLKIKNIRFLTTTNDIFTKESKHYITVFTTADWHLGKPQNLELNKCLRWEWFPTNKLPKNVFLPIKNLLKQTNLSF